MDCTSFMSYLSVILINNVGFSHRSFSIFASIKKKKKDQKALLVFVLCFNVDCKKSVLLASIAEPEGQNI